MVIDGVQVVNMSAVQFQSLTINHTNDPTAVTTNMTKFNTVPTNMSDDMGNIVTEMGTWRTSAVFGELNLIAERCLDSVHVVRMYVCVAVCIYYTVHII